jgi:hypothetical protein
MSEEKKAVYLKRTFPEGCDRRTKVAWLEGVWREISNSGVEIEVYGEKVQYLTAADFILLSFDSHDGYGFLPLCSAMGMMKYSDRFGDSCIAGWGVGEFLDFLCYLERKGFVKLIRE